MERRAHKFQLIGNRFTAIMALCLTGFLAARDLRAVFHGAPQKSGWLIPLDSLPLPIWAVIIFNFIFYVYMLWLAFWFYRGTRGNERVVVGGFFTAALLGLLGPIKALGSPRAVTAIRSVQAIGMSIAFFGALLILLKSPAWQTGDAKTAVRLSLFLGAFVLFAFVVGALLYWTL
jgi:hypothetical protein